MSERSHTRRSWAGRRRCPWFAAWAVALVAACAPPAPSGIELTVALPPGRMSDFERVIAPAFETQTGATLHLIGLRSADQVARVRIERERPTLDVLWIDFAEAELLGREGLLLPISEADAPNLGSVRANARSALGIAPITFSSALGFLYNEEIIDEPPRAWADLWHPRFAGQLALFDFGSSLGPATLVMAARLHGGSETDIEPGFERLVALLPNAYGFRTSGPENNNLVAQGEAGVTLALASQTRDLRDKGAPVRWIVPAEGAIALPQGFQVVAGTPQAALATAFVDYALGLALQTRLARELLLVVTNREVVLPADVAPLVPLDNILYFDFATIGERRGEWTNRFNREVLGG